MLALPWLTASVAALTWFGRPGVLAVFSGVAAVILVRAGRRSDAKLLAFIMAGSLVLENDCVTTGQTRIDQKT